jgi:phage shock protein A
MFEDWKQAWRQAVENFQREVQDGDAPPRVRAMERELVSASGALSKLDTEVRRAGQELARERESEQVCRRREGLARDVADEETARIAAEYAVRHAERASLLARKLQVLEEERALLARDLDIMRDAIAKVAPAAGSVGGGAADSVGAGATAEPRSEAEDRIFSRLEREARERAADERLEELKRRMRR